MFRVCGLALLVGSFIFGSVAASESKPQTANPPAKSQKAASPNPSSEPFVGPASEAKKLYRRYNRAYNKTVVAIACVRDPKCIEPEDEVLRHSKEALKILQKLGLFKEYRWAFSFDDLVLGIGRNGPAVLGINWYEGMGIPDSNNFIAPTGAHVGGHAILARAVDIKKRVITLRNSWGQDWGDNGDCYISFDHLRSLLLQGGEAAFIIKRKTNIIL